MRIITIEEHFTNREIDAAVQQHMATEGVDPARFAFANEFFEHSMIGDLDKARIAYMDKVGIDTQVVGYGGNPPMNVPGEEGVALCKKANDVLYEATQRHPGRLYAYAQIPFSEPEAAIEELRRCRNELGFVGVMAQGPCRRTYFDDESYFPVLEEIARLGMPLYIHPGNVQPAVEELYYQGSWSPAVAMNFAGFGIGWHYEVGVHALRLILAGVFDRIPDLKVIIGHWGELVPYYFDRLDAGLTQDLTGLDKPISEYFRTNIWTNPSGMYFADDMDFCLKTMGAGQIMWGQDFCYLDGREGTDSVRSFLEAYPIADEEREKIAHGNAEELFGI